MLWIVIVLIALAIIAIYLAIPGGRLWKKYRIDIISSLTLVPWYVTYAAYKEQNGYFQPGSVSVNWVLPEGDDTYFVSDNIEVQYSIKEENI